jgi:peptide/nickel transport system ATP-binding protein
MARNLLEIQDLRLKFYTYEGIVEALDGVNLDLKEGETLGLVGETGCGKSVTGLSALVLVPSPGRIEGGHVNLYDDENKKLDLLKQKDDVLMKIRGADMSMIFQDPRSALDPVYTTGNQLAEAFMHHRLRELCKKALEEIEKTKKGKNSFLARFDRRLLNRMQKNPKSFSLRIISKIPLLNSYKRRLNKEVKKECIRMLREMRISDPERVVDMYPHELSGGMAQRVVIAIALACSPRLLIADEPTTNLDVTVQLQILNLIRELKQEYGSSILYITHDMGIIAELCERVAVMYAGSVVEIGEALEIFKNPIHPYTKALLESIPRPGKAFKSIIGTVPSLINPPKGCRFNDRCPYATEACTTVKPKMVEVKKGHYVQCHTISK